MIVSKPELKCLWFQRLIPLPLVLLPFLVLLLLLLLLLFLLLLLLLPLLLLKLRYDEPHSNFALKFNLRRYSKGREVHVRWVRCLHDEIFRAVQCPEGEDREQVRAKSLDDFCNGQVGFFDFYALPLFGLMEPLLG